MINNTQILHITLDQVDFFDLSFNKLINQDYFNGVKEAIRCNKHQQHLCVTKRPGEDKFILSDGGSYRLKALKELYQETGVKRFNELLVEYMPFTSNSDLIMRHIVSNDSRGKAVFSQRAVAVHKAKQEWKRENPGQHLSLDTFYKLFNNRNALNIQLHSVYLFLFCVEELLEMIPIFLQYEKYRNSNPSFKPKKLSSETIRKLLYGVLKEADKEPQEFNPPKIWYLFMVSLSECLDRSSVDVELQFQHFMNLSFEDNVHGGFHA